MSVCPPAVDLQPIKASLVVDLVDLININLADLVTVEGAACPTCKGVGIVGDRDEGNDTTCATCQGVGAVEQFKFDMERMKTQRYGRLIEGWDVKQGQIVPKMRSKDKAFATLVRILGFDKAVIEIGNATAFTDSISPEQRATYVAQVAELAKSGALDGL